MYFFAGVTLIVTQIALIGAENSTYHLAAYPTIFQLLDNVLSNVNKLRTWSNLDNLESRLLVENVKKFTENVLVEDLTKAFSTEDHTIIANISSEINLNFPEALTNITNRTAESFAGYSRSLQLLRTINKLLLRPNFLNVSDSSLIVANIQKFAQMNIVKDIAKAFKTDNYTTISDISNQIYVDSPTKFRDLIKRAIRRSFSKILQNTTALFECFDHHKHEAQSAHVYLAMIEEFISRNKLNESLVVTFAVHFKNAYYKVCSINSNDIKDCSAVIYLSRTWPPFLRSLVTDKPICIQSKETQYYVYNIVDQTRTVRSVFKIPNICLDNVKWILEPYKNALRIKSFDNGGYLSGRDKVYLDDSINEYNGISTLWSIEHHSENDAYIKKFSPEKYVYVGTDRPDTSALLKQKETIEANIFSYKQIPKYNITEANIRAMEHFQNELDSINIEISKMNKKINKHYLLLSEYKFQQSLWTIAPCNDVAC